MAGKSSGGSEVCFSSGRCRDGIFAGGSWSRIMLDISILGSGSDFGNVSVNESNDISFDRAVLWVVSWDSDMPQTDTKFCSVDPAMILLSESGSSITFMSCIFDWA